MKVLKPKKPHIQQLVVDLTTVEDLYGEQNLAETSLFSGGFINFGYWKHLKTHPIISARTRALSSQRLYEKIFDILSINTTDSILEIGCGLGNGCVLLHQKYNPVYVIGIDASSAQIQRAIQRHEKYLKKTRDSLIFSRTTAEDFRISPNSISKAFSVEALQHFDSIEKFLKTIFKALKPGGRLVVTTFFLKSKPPQDFFDLFPNFASGVDKLINVNDFSQKLLNHGFINLKSESIGPFVWPGFDKWISQTEYKDTWDKNWLQAYKRGILDYYVFEMEKPLKGCSYESKC